MRVYYESSLWHSRANECNKRKVYKCGKVQKINWSFEYLGQKCYIPNIYRFKEGIVFDIVTPVEESLLQAYFEKCKLAHMEDEYERRHLEECHPYQAIHLWKIWLNGEKIKSSWSSSGQLYSSFKGEDKRYTEFKRTYSTVLKDKAHFGISRVCVPYPKPATGFQRFKRPKRGDAIVSLKFMTHEVQKYYLLGKEFELSPTQKTYALEITHPISKVPYSLFFEMQEQEHLEVAGHQIHGTSAKYCVKPSLKDGEHLDFDSSISYKSEPKSPYEPEAVGSIGIIGGASGPRALYLSDGKTKEKICFSKPSFEKQEAAKFNLKGMYIKEVPRQTYIYEKSDK